MESQTSSGEALNAASACARAVKEPVDGRDSQTPSARQASPCPQLYRTLLDAARDDATDGVAAHVDAITTSLQMAFPYTVHMLRLSAGKASAAADDSATPYSQKSQGAPQHKDCTATEPATQPTPSLTRPEATSAATATATTTAAEAEADNTSPAAGKKRITFKKPPAFAQTSASTASVHSIVDVDEPAGTPDARETELTAKAVTDLLALLETFEQFLRTCVRDTLHPGPRRTLDDDDKDDNDDLNDRDLSRGESDNMDLETFVGERGLDETISGTAGINRCLQSTTNSSTNHRQVSTPQTCDDVSLPCTLNPTPQLAPGAPRRTASNMAPSVVIAVAPVPPLKGRSARSQDTPDTSHLNGSRSSMAAYHALRLSGPTMSPQGSASPQANASPPGTGRQLPARPALPVRPAPLDWARVLAIANVVGEYLYQALFAAPGSRCSTATGPEEDTKKEVETESLVDRQRRMDMTVSRPLTALHEAFFRFTRTRLLDSIIASDNASTRARCAQLAAGTGVTSATMRSANPSLTSRAAVLSLSTSHRALATGASSLLSPPPEAHPASGAAAPCEATSARHARHDRDSASVADSFTDGIRHLDRSTGAGTAAVEPATPGIPEVRAALEAEEEEMVRQLLLSWWVWLFGASGLAEATLLLLHQPSTSSSRPGEPPEQAHEAPFTPSFDFLIGAVDYLSRQYVLDHSGRLNSSSSIAKLDAFAALAGLPQDVLCGIQRTADLNMSSSESVSRAYTALANSFVAPSVPSAQHRDALTPSSSPLSYDPAVVNSARRANETVTSGRAGVVTSPIGDAELTGEERITQERITHILCAHTSGAGANLGKANAENSVGLAASLPAALEAESSSPFSPVTRGTQREFVLRDTSNMRRQPPHDMHRRSQPHLTGATLTGASEAVSAHTNRLINAFLSGVRDSRAREPLFVCSESENDDAAVNVRPVPTVATEATKTRSSLPLSPSGTSPRANHSHAVPGANGYVQLQRVQYDTATARHALQFATRLGNVYGTQDMNGLLPLLPQVHQSSDTEVSAWPMITTARSLCSSPQLVEVAQVNAVAHNSESATNGSASTVGPPPSPHWPSGKHAPVDLLHPTTTPANNHPNSSAAGAARPHVPLSPSLGTHRPRLDSLRAVQPGAPQAPPPPPTSSGWSRFLPKLPDHPLQRREHAARLHVESGASALQHDRLVDAMHLHQVRTFTTLHSPTPFSMDADVSTELALSLTLTITHGLLTAWKALNEGCGVGVTQTHTSTERCEAPLASAATVHTRVSALFGLSDARWGAIADTVVDNVQFAVLTSLGRSQAPLSVVALKVASILESETHARRAQPATAPSSSATTGATSPTVMGLSETRKTTVPRAPAQRQTFPVLWLSSFVHFADSTRHLLSADHNSPKPLEVSMWYLAGLAEYYVQRRLHVLQTAQGGCGANGASTPLYTVATLQAALAPDALHASSLSLHDREVLTELLRSAQCQQSQQSSSEGSEEAAEPCVAPPSTWSAFWRRHYTSRGQGSATSRGTLSEASRTFIQDELVAPAEQIFGVLTCFLETIASSYLSVAREVRDLEGYHDTSACLSDSDSPSDDDDDADGGDDDASDSSAAVRWADTNSDMDGDLLNSSLRAPRGSDETEDYAYHTDAPATSTRSYARRHRDRPSRRREHHHGPVRTASVRDHLRWTEMCVHYFLEVFDVLLDVSCALERRPLFLHALTVGLYSSRSLGHTEAALPTAQLPTAGQTDLSAERKRPHQHTSVGAASAADHEHSKNTANEASKDDDDVAYSPLQQFLTIYSNAVVQRAVNRIHNRRNGSMPSWLRLELLSFATSPSTVATAALMRAAQPTEGGATEGSPAPAARLSSTRVREVPLCTSATWEISTMCWPGKGLKSWCRYLRVLQHNELVTSFLVDAHVHALTVSPSGSEREKLHRLLTVTANEQRPCAGSELFISGISALIDTSQGPCAQLLSLSCTRPTPGRVPASGSAAVPEPGTAVSRTESYKSGQSIQPGAATLGDAGSQPDQLSACGALWLRLQMLRLLRAATTPLDLRQRRHFCYNLLLFASSAPKHRARQHFRQIALELLQRPTILKASQSPLYARLLLLRIVQALVSSRHGLGSGGKESVDQRSPHQQMNPLPTAAAAIPRAGSTSDDCFIETGADDPLAHSLNNTTRSGVVRGTPPGPFIHKLGSMRSQISSQSSGGGGLAGGQAVVPYTTTLSMWNVYTFELLQTFRELCWYHTEAHLEANKLGAPSVLAQFLASLISTVDDAPDSEEAEKDGTGTVPNSGLELHASGVVATGSDGGAEAATTAPATQPVFVPSADAVPAGFVDFDDYGKDSDEGEGNDDQRTTTPAPSDAAEAVTGPQHASEQARMASRTHEGASETAQATPTPPTAAAVPTPLTGLLLPKLSLAGLGPALYYASSGDTGAAQEAALLFNSSITAAREADHVASLNAQDASSPTTAPGTAERRGPPDGALAATRSHDDEGAGRRALTGNHDATAAGAASRTDDDDNASPLAASLTLTGTSPRSAQASGRPADLPPQRAAPPSAAPRPFTLPTLSLANLGPPLYFLSSGDTGMAQSQATNAGGLAVTGAPSAVPHTSDAGRASCQPPEDNAGPRALPPAVPPLNVSAVAAPAAACTTTTTTNTMTNHHSPPHPNLPRGSGGGSGRPPLPVTAPALRGNGQSPEGEEQGVHTAAEASTAKLRADPPITVGHDEVSELTKGPATGEGAAHAAARGRPAARGKPEPVRGAHARRNSLSSGTFARTPSTSATAVVPVQTVQRVVPTLRRQDSLRRQASLNPALAATDPVLITTTTNGQAPPSTLFPLLRIPCMRSGLGSGAGSAADASLSLTAMASPSFPPLSSATSTPAAVGAPQNAKSHQPATEAPLQHTLSPAITAELILNLCSLILQHRGGMINYGFTVSALVQRKLPATYAIQPRVLTSLISHVTSGGGEKGGRQQVSGDRVSRRFAAAQLAPTPQGPSSFHVLRSLREYVHTRSKSQRAVVELLRQWLTAQFGPSTARLWAETSAEARARLTSSSNSLPTHTDAVGLCGSDDYGCQPLATGMCALLWLLMPDKTALATLEVSRRLGTGGYGSVMAAQYQPARRLPSQSGTVGAKQRKGTDGASTFHEVALDAYARATKVALKMLPLSLQGSEGGMLPTIHAEVLNMLRLRGHPHVVEVLSFGCTGDEYFLAMPHYEIGSVQRWRVTRYPPGCAPLMEKPAAGEETRCAAPRQTTQRTITATKPDNEEVNPTENQLFRLCADVFTQVLEAVAFMHARNIRHGDIKADNVFVAQCTGGTSPRLHVRVGDFGSSDTCDEDDLRALVRDVESGEARFLAGRWGSGRGTEATQPPEMLFPKRRYQVLSSVLDDIYARYEAEEAQRQTLDDDELTRATESEPLAAADATAPAGCSVRPGFGVSSGTATATAGASGNLNLRLRSHASISEAVFSAARDQVRRAELSVDMWACGCLLYELLTGRMLFGGARVGRAFVLATTAMKEQLSHADVAATVGQATEEPDTLPSSLTPTAAQRSTHSGMDTMVAVKTLDEWERRDLRLAVGEAVVRFMSSLLSLNPLERPTATEALYRWKELLSQRQNILEL